ncbi:phage integrase family protein [Vibrio crassostreae]|nr:phage integrase family protein [Vibrio crassostreae]ROR77279.1 phage integrase family protein [Vibrio crassostreae]RPE99249.1 phage integrase family protein [Vibrio crassostreae]TQL30959.1 phage integrase family protein [Vibrio crassostreae]
MVLEIGTKMKYLTQKKTGTWYFRYQVPFLYRRFFDNRTEIKKSLHTSDKMTAHVKALKLESAVKERIMTIKQYLTLEAANKLIATHTGSTLMKIECAVDPMSELSTEYMSYMLAEIAKDENLSASNINSLMSPIEYLTSADKSATNLANEALSNFELSPIDPLTWQTRQALIQVFQYAKDAQSALKNSDQQACENVVKQLEKVMLKVDPDPDLAKSLSSEPAAQVISNATPVKDDRSLKELFEEYEEEKKFSIKPRSLDLARAKIHTVSELLHDKPASSINRREAVLIRDSLLELPSNIHKKKEFKGISLLEAIKKNKALSTPLTTLGKTTVKDYLQKVSSLCKWAVRHQYLEHNHFESIKTQSRQESKKESDVRHPFSNDMLTKIFSTRIFTHNDMLHSFHYWLPILALYTGARQNELAQLFRENIVQIDGIWCISFTECHPSQDFKTDSSERITPIHSKLIELGFLEFVESCEGRLFATGLPFYEGKGYGKEASRWFNETYKTKLGMKANTGYTFHSFRHTVLDMYKQHSDVEERFAQGIVGHKHGSITFDRYGSEFHPSALKPYIDLLEWSFLKIQPFNLVKHFDRTEKELLKSARRKANKAKNKSD